MFKTYLQDQLEEIIPIVKLPQPFRQHFHNKQLHLKHNISSIQNKEIIDLTLFFYDSSISLQNLLERKNLKDPIVKIPEIFWEKKITSNIIKNIFF